MIFPSGSQIYYGASAGIYYCKLRSRHYMFQAGLEYSDAKYYFAELGTNTSIRYQKWYSNTLFSISTVTTPAYFNLLLFSQTLFIGGGPNLDILPYTYMTGNEATWQYGVTGPRVEGQTTTFIRGVDIGAAFKIGGFVKIGNSQFTIEAKAKCGLLNLLSINLDSGGHLHNTYFTTTIGYIIVDR